MLLDITPEEFERIARAGFFTNVSLRAKNIETAQMRCKSLGLHTAGERLYRTGDLISGATDIYFNLIYSSSGFWLVKRKIQ